MKPFWKIFLAFCAVTLVSALSFRTSELHAVLFFGITITVLAFSLCRLEYGILILIAELLIGSKGHLFWFDIPGDEMPLRISLRMALFAVVLLAWVINRLRTRTWPALLVHPSFRFVLPFLCILVYALAQGIWLQNYTLSAVFADANNWFFIAFIFPLFDVAHESPHFFKHVWFLTKVAVVFLITKALFFFIVYALALPNLTEYLYHFERQTGGGQLAPAPQGMWRIYFWSELFLLPAFFMAMSGVWVRLEERRPLRKQLIVLFSIILTLVLTLFRSFWLGAAVGFVVWIVTAFFFPREQHPRMFHVRTLGKIIGYVSVFVFAAAILLQSIGTGLSALAGDRPAIQKQLFTTQEPGVQNRINQFRPLIEKIQERPILGSGFGTTVTYKSLDERNKGVFTTTALELGWLDMVMEIGLLGVALLLCMIGSAFFVVWRHMKKERAFRPLGIALIAGVFAIAATHSVSPFLNHPLGLVFLLFVFVFAHQVDREHHFV